MRLSEWQPVQVGRASNVSGAEGCGSEAVAIESALFRAILQGLPELEVVVGPDIGAIHAMLLVFSEQVFDDVMDPGFQIQNGSPFRI